MVEVGTALGGVEDTARVELEDEGISLNSNGNWAVSDGSLEGDSAIGGNLSVT